MCGTGGQGPGREEPSGLCCGGAGWADTALQGTSHSSGREGRGLRGPTGHPLSPAEKRTLLVKELQGLPVAQRDHMLRGMPLSLAEKRHLRSVPLSHAWPSDLLPGPRAGGVVEEKGAEAAVGGPWQAVGSLPAGP